MVTVAQRTNDFALVQKVAFDIIGSEGPSHNRRTPDGKKWTITDLCVLREWMNRNIRYQKDSVTHGTSDGQTGPAKLLQTRREDCEDHGMLFGSMVQALGGYCRLVSVYAQSKGHAFTEVCLGHSSTVNMTTVENEIRAFHEYRGKLLDIPQNAYICSSSSGLSSGWKLNNSGVPVRSRASCRYWTFTWSGAAYYQTRSGHVYLIADTLFGSYIGDIGTFVRQGYRTEKHIDINRSSVASLEKVLGIEKAIAEKIVNHRPHRSIEELKRYGFRPAILGKIRSRTGSFDPRAPFWNDCRYKYPFPNRIINTKVYSTHTLDGGANGLSPAEATQKLQAKSKAPPANTSNEVYQMARMLLEVLGSQQSSIAPQDDKGWYYGPEKQKLYLSAEQVMERVQQNPAAEHFVYATGEWIDGRWVKDEWVSARDIPDLRGVMDALLQRQPLVDTVRNGSQNQRAEPAPSVSQVQKLHEEFTDPKNNRWMLIMEAKWFVKEAGEWHLERLSLVAKRIRLYDKRISNRILRTWVQRYYSNNKEIVFPVSIKRKEVMKLFLDIYRTGQFPQQEFNGWVAQRGIHNKTRIPKRNG